MMPCCPYSCKLQATVRSTPFKYNAIIRGGESEAAKRLPRVLVPVRVQTVEHVDGVQ